MKGEVEERSNDIQFVNWIVLYNLIVDQIRKIGLNEFKAVSALLYEEINTSIFVFYFDKFIRTTSEDFENSPQLTTAIIHLWRFLSIFEA